MSPENTEIDRRALLRALPLLPLALGTSSRLLARPAAGTVPFLGRQALEPGTLTGTGLDGRLAYDLTRLVPEGAVVENADFFVRTSFPDGLAASDRHQGDWIVLFSAGEDASGHLRDFGGPDSEVTVRSLRARAKPMGRHLIECSGNSQRNGFGLIGMAEWSGVSLRELCSETLYNVLRSALLLVTGNDDHQTSSPAASHGSTAGASWIFTIGQIEKAGAFLATGMNGEPLPRNHGGPVRLVMPGWYGCTSIKWVESVRVVHPSQPATAHMLEFASRTHQEGRPELARDYLPATIDFAAMPILVEGPDDDGAYLVTGIAWGDPSGVETLSIRYADPDAGNGDSAARWLPVTGFEPQNPSTWTTWQHRFEPASRGVYEITLKPGEAGVRARRLAANHYLRTMRI